MCAHGRDGPAVQDHRGIISPHNNDPLGVSVDVHSFSLFARKENGRMKIARQRSLMVLFALLFLGGPSDILTARLKADDTDGKRPTASGEEARIQANLAKLSPEDRILAEAQRWCAVEDDHRLGSMGVPAIVLVKGQPVFLCCKGCKEEALADPDKTLAKVKELKEKAAKSPEK